MENELGELTYVAPSRVRELKHKPYPRSIAINVAPSRVRELKPKYQTA